MLVSHSGVAERAGLHARVTITERELRRQLGCDNTAHLFLCLDSTTPASESSRHALRFCFLVALLLFLPSTKTPADPSASNHLDALPHSRTPPLSQTPRATRSHTLQTQRKPSANPSPPTPWATCSMQSPSAWWFLAPVRPRPPSPRPPHQLTPLSPLPPPPAPPPLPPAPNPRPPLHAPPFLLPRRRRIRTPLRRLRPHGQPRRRRYATGAGRGRQSGGAADYEEEEAGVR